MQNHEGTHVRDSCWAEAFSCFTVSVNLSSVPWSIGPPMTELIAVSAAPRVSSIMELVRQISPHARVPRGWWRRQACAAPPVRPSTREMLTISRPPPRRCSAACLPGSATRRLCIFGKGGSLRNKPQYPTKGYAPHIFSPTAGCPVTMLHVCALFRVFIGCPVRVFTPARTAPGK